MYNFTVYCVLWAYNSSDTSKVTMVTFLELSDTMHAHVGDSPYNSYVFYYKDTKKDLSDHIRSDGDLNLYNSLFVIKDAIISDSVHTPVRPGCSHLGFCFMPATGTNSKKSFVLHSYQVFLKREGLLSKGGGNLSRVCTSYIYVPPYCG